MTIRTIRVAAWALDSWRVFLATVAVAVLAAGCAREGQSTGSGAAPGGSPADRPANSMLAYEHTYSVKLEPKDVRSRFEAVRAACLQAAAGTCTLLAAELSSGEYTTGRIVARTAPAFVADLVELAARDGEIEHQTTATQDLTTPVADTERNLAWLTRHRDQLIGFQDRKDINVAQLIQLSEQIARTQGQIESLTAERGNLQRRIDTDLVTITLQASWSGQSVLGPLSEAAADFVPNFFLALGGLVQLVSFLLPWLLVFVPVGVGIRYAYRRFRAWRNARPQSGARAAGA